MVQFWMGWCRLCAREDPSNTHINVLLKNEEGLPLTKTIAQCFAIKVSSFSNLPIVICSECYRHIRTTISLNERIAKASAMFAELQVSSNYEEEFDPYSIKARHNLEYDFKVFTTDNSPCLENATDFKPRDKLLDIDEQMIELESMSCNKTLDSNPIKIKLEQDEIYNNNEDCLYSQSEESSNSSASEKTSVKQHANRVKRRYRHKIEKEADDLKKPHYCSECRKGFLKLYNYRRHMQVTHGITLDSEPKQFICENCGKEYKTSSALKEHMLSHTEERTLKCRYCEKTFKGNPSLKNHEDTHNETNYICVICGLKLNTQQTLRMHMLVHSDQKKHKCDHCGNEFKRVKALKNHLILHTGLKPYSCDFCDRTFASGSNCRSHKRKSHPVELAEQEAAGKKHMLKSKIPKLSELKAATASKAVVSKTKERSQREKGKNSLSALKSQVDLPSNSSLDYKKLSAKEESDFGHGIFGKKYF